MLELTGSVEVPEVGETHAEGVVWFLSVEQYERFPEDSHGKPVLGEAAETTIQRFLAGEATTDPAGIISALAGPAGAGRLLLYSTDEREQDAFVQAPTGRSFTYDGDDPAIAVVRNNAAGSRADYFLEQELDLEQHLGLDGSAWTIATLRLRNTAQTVGFDDTAIGWRFGPGTNRLHVSLYCAPDCRFRRFQRDGECTGMTVERELGWRVHSSWEELPTGTAVELRYEWQQDPAWEPAFDHLMVRLLAQPVSNPPIVSAVTVRPDARCIVKNRYTRRSGS